MWRRFVGELTLVPEGLAQPGYRFYFQGANKGEECDGCPVKPLCFRIKPGRLYEVREVRDVAHPCNLHDGDRVRVCTVEPVPVTTTLEDKHLRGTAARWDPVPCGYPECSNYRLCHPVGPVAGARYTIIETKAPVHCPMRYAIHEVVLEPLDR